MSEFRCDPVTGTWTLVVPERAGRPKDFSRAPEESAEPEHCPLCAGHEHNTPPTLYLGELPGTAGWVTRVVDNKFPALHAPAGVLGAEDVDAPPPYRATTGFGGHEVIIETPRHGEGLADYGDAHARLIVDTLIDRVRFWREDGRVADTVIFRNWGMKAGASLAHAHMQLTALPRVPYAVVRELGNFIEHSEKTRGRCLLCDANSADEAEGRLVAGDALTAVYSPYAAPIPYALRLTTRRCTPSVIDLTAEERDSLGRSLVGAARAYRALFGDPAFNMWFHLAPYRVADTGGLPYHWHADFILRTSDQAGFEWATRSYLNQVDPTQAARELRDALHGG